jgi:hypothetical protein
MGPRVCESTSACAAVIDVTRAAHGIVVKTRGREGATGQNGRATAAECWLGGLTRRQQETTLSPASSSRFAGQFHLRSSKIAHCMSY